MKNTTYIIGLLSIFLVNIGPGYAEEKIGDFKVKAHKQAGKTVDCMLKTEAVTRLFTSPRETPLRKVDAVPETATSGKAAFSGTARPGEFFVFQVSVAPGNDTGVLSMQFSDLHNGQTVIPSSALRCISLGGVGNDGRAFTKSISVPAGAVQILWCGVDVPRSATGSYRGRIELREGTNILGHIDLELRVDGKPLNDHGDSNAGNLSRLRWLDSTVGSEATLTAPFIAVQTEGRSVKVLGRELVVGDNGLPTGITSFFNAANTRILDSGRPLLAGPFTFIAQTQTGALTWRNRFGKLEHDDHEARWTAECEADGVHAEIAGRLDYTGSGELSITLRATRDLVLKDIRLEVPWAEAASDYFMGLHHRGGRRPSEPMSWTWDVKKRQDCFWMGDVNAGMMLRFKDENFVRPLVNIYYNFNPLKLPKSWGNDGQGGIKVGAAAKGVVLASAFSGPRVLKAGESLSFITELYLTPFRPLDTEKQWAVRFFHPHPMRQSGRLEKALESMEPSSGANVLNVHQANASAPYINYPYADDSMGELASLVKRGHEKGVKVRIYYTTREITQNMPELHALHSMNGEIIFPGPGAAARTLIHKKGPHPWLIENLGDDFIPAWVDHIRRPGTEWDLSVITTPDSRWNNFYLEGLRWMCDKIDIDGIYIDDTALDARSLRRARRILDRRPGRLIDFHTWNHFNGHAGYANNLTIYLELLPYLDRLWIGEGFHCGRVAWDYWLIEMSGLPFGLMGEMLQNPNPWRGLVFGQVQRYGWSGDPRAIWKAWDEYGIQGTEFIPFYVPENPVRTDRDDVLATVYRRKGRSLVALASWATEHCDVKLTVNWRSLGLDPSRATLYTPPIAGFQQEALWKPGESIKIAPGRGYFLVLDEVARKVTTASDTVTLESLLEEMVNRDAPARFPESDYRQFQASTYNRESTFRDAPGWFADSDGLGFIRTEVIHGKKEWVLMEHDGPGCITRIWAPFFYYGGINDKNGPNIKFYLDGSAKPVINTDFIKLITIEGFIPAPFSMETARAGDVYLPIPFAKSCKITMDKKSFYNIINYRAYPEGTEVETFTMDRYRSVKDKLEQTGRELLFPSAYAKGDKKEVAETISKDKSLTITLPERSHAIRCLEIKLNPEAIASNPAILRSTILTMTFDDDQTMWCPLGDFFGSANSLNPFHTWHRSVTKDGVMTCRWVMPYQKTGAIKLIALDDTAVSIKVSVITDTWTWDDRSMHFHADWRPDDILQGHKFQDWNFIDIKGKGVVVGDQWTVLNRTRGWWGEGDEKIYVDNAWEARFPTHFGTGTEDYYGWAGGVVPDKSDKFNHPYLANILVGSTEEDNTRGFNICTRQRGLDAIAFTKRLRFDMEASPGVRQRNYWDLLGYSSVIWWYALPGATDNRPPLPESAAQPIMSLAGIEAQSAALRNVKTKQVTGAVEGETLKITAKSDGFNVHAQLPSPQFKPNEVLSGALQLGWCDVGTDVHKLRYYRQVEPGKPKMIECDVAVYGGTPAGVTAAIQAARMGKKVVFLSFNLHVGGMTSGGLTASDLGQRDSIGGLALEFYSRLGKKSHFRPSEAESLFLKMLDEAGVSVLFERCLESVTIKDGRLVSATMETGETVKAAVFIDTTYEGDLLAAANVSYRVGREPASAYGESLAGQWQRVSWKNTYQFCGLPLSPYVEPGKPETGLLPEISSEPPGNAGEGDFKVQAYNFRMYLTDKVGKIPFPKPRGYDHDRYALLTRFLNADPRIRWTLNYTTSPMTDGPIQMRIGDSNNAGSFSSDYIGGNYRWPDGTYEAGSFAELPPPRRGVSMPFRELYELRERIFQDHVNYQQGLMYFLANDPRVPDTLRDRVNCFGLDPREFQETGFWPHQLYVREGRRMVSEYVMTQANCESRRTVNDSIGLASYAMDSHFCQRVVVEEDGKHTVRNEGGFGHRCPGPYPVSYRSIIPKREGCTNLLVPVCLSASHVAYGSIRMEPVFMILGQSAAVATVLAIDAGVAVQDISYEKLKSRLLKVGQQISLP